MNSLYDELFESVGDMPPGLALEMAQDLRDAPLFMRYERDSVRHEPLVAARLSIMMYTLLRCRADGHTVVTEGTPREIAIHEAGHVVAAFTLGLRPTYAAIHSTPLREDAAGVCYAHKSGRRDWIWRDTVMSMAGPAAGILGGWCWGFGGDLQHSMQAVLPVTRGPRDRVRYIVRAHLAAEKIVCDQVRAVTRVADALVERGDLEGEDLVFAYYGCGEFGS